MKIKAAIQAVLGPGQSVEHLGASALGISGQDEIDVYVPVPADRFDEVARRMETIFGEPGSRYPSKRTRFVTYVDGKHVDVFIINQEGDGWKDGIRFHSFLASHQEALDNYRKLKEEAAGQSVREYYRRKIGFINDILAES